LLALKTIGYFIRDHWAAIAASLAALNSLRNGKKVSDLRVEVNGKLTKLLEVQRAEGLAAGIEEGRRLQRLEHATPRKSDRRKAEDSPGQSPTEGYQRQ
jgi:hypothetical protein